MSEEAELAESTIANGGGESRSRGSRWFRRLRRLALWGFLVVFVVLAVLWALVESPYLSERLRQIAIDTLSRGLDRTVEIGYLDLDLLPLQCELRDVRIAGQSAEVSPNVLELERIALSGRLLGLLDFDPGLLLRYVEIEGLRLYVEVDADGQDNLPRWQSAGEESGDFELHLGGVEVIDSVLVVNETSLPLNLEAGDVDASFVGLGGLRIHGDFSVAEFLLQLPSAEPYRADLEGRLVIDEKAVEISHATVRSEFLELRSEGHVSWTHGSQSSVSQGAELPVSIQLAIQGALDGRLVEQLGYLDGLSGKVDLTGQFSMGSTEAESSISDRDMDKEDKEREPELARSSWQLALELSAQELSLFENRVQGLVGTLLTDESGIELVVRDGRWAEGSVTARYLQPLSSNAVSAIPVGRARLTAELSGASLQEILIAQRLPVRRLEGSVFGRGRYEFDLQDPLSGGGLIDLRVDAPKAESEEASEVPDPDADISDEARLREEPPAPLLRPLVASLPLVIERGRVTSQALRVLLPSQLLTASGFYRLKDGVGGLDYRLNSGDLSTLADLIETLPLEDGDEPVPLPIRIETGAGEASGRLDVRGAEVSGTLSFEVRDTTTDYLSFDQVSGSLGFSPEGIRDLVIEGKKGRGAALVRIPRLEGAQAVLRATISNWSLDDLGPSIPVSTDLLQGSAISGDLTISLAQQTLGEGSFDGSIEPLRILNLDFSRADGALRFSSKSLEIDEATIRTQAGPMELAGFVDLAEQRFNIELEASGLDASKQPFAQWDRSDVGLEIDVDARLRGSFEKPDLIARVESRMDDLEASVLLVDWDGSTLEASGELGGLISVEGGGPFGAGGSDVRLTVQNGDLAPLVELAVAATGYLPEEGSLIERMLEEGVAGGFRGELELSSNGEQPLAVVLAVDEFRIATLDRELTAAVPFRLLLRDGGVELDGLYLLEEATDSELIVSGRLSSGDPGVDPFDVGIESSLTSDWLELFGLDLDFRGRFDMLAVLRGSSEEPRFNGQGGVRGASVVLPDFPHQLENLDFTVFLYPDRIVLDRLSARLAGGDVRSAGSLRWDDMRNLVEQGQFEVNTRVKGANLRYPEGWSVRGDAEIALRQGADGQRLLSGTVDLRQASYLAEVDVGLTQLLRSALTRSRVQVLEIDPLLDSVRVNLDVQGEDSLRVRNNLADLRGDIDLRVQGTLGRPVLFGQVELERGGQLTYAGEEYEITKGLLTFANPYKIDPLVDLTAATRRRDYDVLLNLSGTRDRLDASLSSDPPLPEIEVLSLLAAGQTSLNDTGLAPAGSAGASLSAADLLYRQAANLVGDRVSTLFGLDRFRLDPLASGDSVSSARVTVGKRLSKDVFVTYSVDPSSTENSVLEVEWHISDHLVLVLVQNADGSYSADARFEQSF